MRIAMLFPYAPAYRECIYRLMDENFDVDWFFAGNAIRPLKLLDYSFLKRCDLSMKESRVINRIIRYKGIKSLNLSQYDVIITSPDIRNLSAWWLLHKFGHSKKGPKVFFWAHGWYGRENRLQSVIKRYFFSLVDGAFIYNDRSVELMVKQGIPKESLYTIYNSLDYDRQLPIRKSMKRSGLYEEYFGNNNPVIVFIGRLTKEKQLDMILTAALELQHRKVPVNVVFIGDGNERQSLEEKSNEIGLSATVWFYGACYDEYRNAELIYNADLCVSPGEIGLTAIHALMFGCPAITHDDYAHQGPEFEAIHIGETGDFFHKGDVNSLIDIISRWFLTHQTPTSRESVRDSCYKEIDSKWNPHKQIDIIKSALGITNNEDKRINRASY